MHSEVLLDWTRLFGELYGTEDQALLFYSLVKMQRPENILELGTGFGVTAFWMAQALKENRAGRVWSVDNGEHWEQMVQQFGAATPSPLLEMVERVRSHPKFGPLFFPEATDRRAQPGSLGRIAGYWNWLEGASSMMELTQHLTLLRGSFLTGKEIGVSPEIYPYMRGVLEKPIDILFADVEHSIQSVLGVLSQFLPYMAESSSIFMDSAATWLPSYLTLEQTVQQLNHGKVPPIFLTGTNRKQKARVIELIATRRFTLIPLIEQKHRWQNGLIWIKIEPINIMPYPLTAMRGVVSQNPTPAKALKAFFQDGQLF